MRSFLILALILAVIGAFWFTVSRFFTLADIQVIGRAAVGYTQRHPLIVFSALAAAHMVGMIFSLPTKMLVTLLGGALLGVALGSLSTVLGVVTGTSILFYLARYWLRDRFVSKIGRRARQIEQRLSSNPIRAMIGLRLFITLPFGPITLAAALSSMRYRDFIIGTLLGDIPVVVAYSVAAQQLFTLTSTTEALSATTVAALLGVGLFFIIAALLGNRRKQPQTGE